MTSYIYPGTEPENASVLAYKEAIEKITGWYFTTETGLKSKSRDSNIVQCRQLVAYYGNRVLKLTDTETGKHINRNRATVLHSVKTVLNLYETNQQYRKLVAFIEAETGLNFGLTK